MVRVQLRGRDISDERVLKVMAEVPRHQFVAKELESEAYSDRPLPIPAGQTISQPYIVALTAQLLELSGNERVLEIGAGCGYQTAVFARLAQYVVGIEWHEELAKLANEKLVALGIENAEIHQGDGKLGWPIKAPYNRIAVSCAVREVPESWFAQLSSNGMLVFPFELEKGDQRLLRWTRNEREWVKKEEICGVRFVPLL